MAKICFPHHSNGKFDSLKEAVRTLKRRKSGWWEYMLTDIVRYNVCYRDILRKHGIETLIERLVGEAPELGSDGGSLDHLREWWERTKPLGAYDIQCYHVKDRVTILGHTFEGLEDIVRHRGIIGRDLWNDIDCSVPDRVDEYPDVHIGELYSNYPVFDSFDLGDDRTYRNYIFRSSPVTEREMKKAYDAPFTSCFSMVHENMRKNRLPVLYYDGDSAYMLLATVKA